MRVSLRVQPSGVSVELHTETVELHADVLQGEQTRQPGLRDDRRSAHWRGELLHPTAAKHAHLRARLSDPAFCLRFAMRTRKGTGGTERLQWIFHAASHKTNHGFFFHVLFSLLVLGLFL